MNNCNSYLLHIILLKNVLNINQQSGPGFVPHGFTFLLHHAHNFTRSSSSHLSQRHLPLGRPFEGIQKGNHIKAIGCSNQDPSEEEAFCSKKQQPKLQISASLFPSHSRFVFGRRNKHVVCV